MARKRSSKKGASRARYVLDALSTFVVALIMIADRCVLLLAVWRDLPAIHETTTLPREREALVKRVALYVVILLLVVFFRLIAWLFW